MGAEPGPFNLPSLSQAKRRREVGWADHVSSNRRLIPNPTGTDVGGNPNRPSRSQDDPAFSRTALARVAHGQQDRPNCSAAHSTVRAGAGKVESSGIYRLSLDALGKSARTTASLLDSGLSFVDVVKRHRGPTCMSETSKLPHPAAGLLSRIRRSGVPVLQSTLPWTLEQLDTAVQRGPHQSAKANATFMRDEISAMSDAGQWLVAPYRCVRNLPGLRLSPSGVIPQRNRRGRPIIDYTFSGVNAATISVAPDSMQFGHADRRIVQTLHRADTRHGPVHLSKDDISDAFMRAWLGAHSVPILGALLPSHDDEEPLVGFPLVLPMGWIDSPPYLCAITETVADLTNARLAVNDLAQDAHRLDDVADTRPPDLPRPPRTARGDRGLPPPHVRSRGPLQAPVNRVDVFMDDFIQMSQSPKKDRRAVRRTLFECLDSVLRPLAPSDNPCRKEPNSVKKLKQGDGAWTTRKVILGWIMDTVQRTIELPPHRLERITELLDSIPTHQRRTSRKKWQQLLGEFRSMILAIPGGRGMLSQLQATLTYSPTASPTDRLTLSKAVHDQLADLRRLAEDLGSRPTRWGEVVDSDPAFVGSIDASADGMGGVWIDALQKLPPLLWREKFPGEVTKAVVSWTNPTGALTNSDLEQAGLVCHPDILAQQHDLRERTICVLSDNTAAISRDNRGSTSTDAASAYLCRLAALHQRAYRYRLRSSHIPGTLNVMADILSRRWELSDSQLLALFDTEFPQALPWQLCQLRSEMSSSAMQALWKERCSPDFLVDATLPPLPTGTSSWSSVNNLAWQPTLPRAKIQSLGCKSSPSEYETAGFRPAAGLSDLVQWRTPSYSLHRRTPCWVRPTRADSHKAGQ